jgi:hypothetical protein
MPAGRDRDPPARTRPLRKYGPLALPLSWLQTMRAGPLQRIGSGPAPRDRRGPGGRRTADSFRAPAVPRPRVAPRRHIAPSPLGLPKRRSCPAKGCNARVGGDRDESGRTAGPGRQRSRLPLPRSKAKKGPGRIVARRKGLGARRDPLAGRLDGPDPPLRGRPGADGARV